MREERVEVRIRKGWWPRLPLLILCPTFASRLWTLTWVNHVLMSSNTSSGIVPLPNPASQNGKHLVKPPKSHFPRELIDNNQNIDSRYLSPPPLSLDILKIARKEAVPSRTASSFSC